LETVWQSAAVARVAYEKRRQPASSVARSSSCAVSVNDSPEYCGYTNVLPNSSSVAAPPSEHLHDADLSFRMEYRFLEDVAATAAAFRRWLHTNCIYIFSQ